MSTLRTLFRKDWGACPKKLPAFPVPGFLETQRDTAKSLVHVRSIQQAQQLPKMVLAINFAPNTMAQLRPPSDFGSTPQTSQSGRCLASFSPSSWQPGQSTNPQKPGRRSSPPNRSCKCQLTVLSKKSKAIRINEGKPRSSKPHLQLEETGPGSHTVNCHYTTRHVRH